MRLKPVLYYGSVTLASYCYLLGFMYLTVDVFAWPALWCYVVAYFSVYVAVYWFLNHRIFFSRHSRAQLIRFVIHVLVFVGASSLLFALLHGLGLHHLLSVVLTSVVLFPLRFLAYQFFVFVRAHSSRRV